MTRSIAVSTEAGTTARWWVSRTPSSSPSPSSAAHSDPSSTSRTCYTPETALDAATSFMVDAARAEGATWAEIGAPWASAAKPSDKQRPDATTSTTARTEAKTWHMPLPVQRRRLRWFRRRAPPRCGEPAGAGPRPSPPPSFVGRRVPEGATREAPPHPAGSPRARDVHAPGRAVCTRHDQPCASDGRRQSERPSTGPSDDGAGLPPTRVVGILWAGGGVLLGACPHAWGTLITRYYSPSRVLAEISRAYRQCVKRIARTQPLQREAPRHAGRSS